ncbi:hypothetical protein HAX54_044109, partial [Datura stramonium]|nr:hypothetical protein [Datura stramonium]
HCLATGDRPEIRELVLAFRCSITAWAPIAQSCFQVAAFMLKGKVVRDLDRQFTGLV